VNGLDGVDDLDGGGGLDGDGLADGECVGEEGRRVIVVFFLET